MYLLDTNVISEARKAASGRADKNVVTFLNTLHPLEIFCASITIYEIELGILKIENNQPDRARTLRDWMVLNVLQFFDGRILSFDHQCAIAFARLMHPRTRPYRDAMIAATAMAHGFAGVTRNIRDFADLPISVIDPWRPL